MNQSVTVFLLHCCIFFSTKPSLLYAPKGQHTDALGDFSERRAILNGEPLANLAAFQIEATGHVEGSGTEEALASAQGRWTPMIGQPEEENKL